MVEFMKHWTTATAEVYCETLKKTMGPFRTKGSEMLTCGIVFLHDNAHLHTAAHT
jgi:hypothetical protein